MFSWGLFSPKQLDVMFGEWSYINVLEGSVRSGKTVSSLPAWVHYVSQAPRGGALAMVGKTERTLKRNILDPLVDMFGTHAVQLSLGSGEATICGRKVYLFGSSDVRSEFNIRGGTWAGAYCDEATLYSEDFFMMLLSRLSVPGSRLFVTTNPDSPFHWFKTKLLDREAELNAKNPGYLKRWQFRLEDNYNLDPDYVSRLKAQYVGMWYRRYILGEWCLAEGAVYSSHLKPECLVRQQDVPFITQYYVGVDYATSAHTAFVLVGVGIDNNLYVLQEYYHSGDVTGDPKTDLEYVQDLYHFLGHRLPKRIFVDPSAKHFIVQLSRFGDTPLRQGFNRDVLYGIRCVTTLLGAGKLRIVESACPNLLTEIGSYSWDSKSSLRGEDKPIKQKDHLLDGLRYAVVGMYSIWRPWLIAYEDSHLLTGALDGA